MTSLRPALRALRTEENEMDIEEAFTPEAIELAGTDVGADEEDDLRQSIISVFELGPDDVVPDAVMRACMICFVAGRTHQSDRTVINMPMTIPMLQGWLSYITQGGS